MASKKKNKAKKIEDLSQERADQISQMMEQFERLIEHSSESLTEAIIKTFSDALSIDNGSILTDVDNMRKVALIDKAWNTFNNQTGVEIITTLITDAQTINQQNLKYYRTLSDAQINMADIRNIVNSRLGIDSNGDLVKGGYMKGLLDDVTVRNQIKQFAINKISAGVGFTDLNKGFKDLIEGNPETMGAFKQFHRNFSFDTHAQIDRLNGTLFAEKLKLKYFIYQGTRRKGSRFFCLQNKGKVFSTEEADHWKELIGKTKSVPGAKDGTTKRILIGPIVEDIATYNPTIDMGGFGCVDIASFISEEIAFMMRPDLKK